MAPGFPLTANSRNGNVRRTGCFFASVPSPSLSLNFANSPNQGKGPGFFGKNGFGALRTTYNSGHNT